MNWFKNMKIRMKLLLSFILVVVLSVLIAIVGLVALTNSSDTYIHLIDYPSERRAKFTEAEFLLMSARRDYCFLGVLSGDLQALDAQLANANNSLDQFIDVIETCRTNLRDDLKVDQVLKATRYVEMDMLISGVNDFRQNGIIPMYDLMKTGTATQEDILATINYGTAIASSVSNLIGEMLESNISVVNSTKEVARSTETTMMTLLITIAAAVAVIATVLALYVSGVISKPLIPLHAFMVKAGETGDIKLTQADIDTIGIYSSLKDETGQTIKATAGFVQHITNISNALEEVAGGNLTVETKVLSDNDVIGNALNKMTDNLNNMFADILSSSREVSTGSKQVADGAQSLAQGSTEQAASIQELSSSISEISEKTKTNAKRASRAAELADTIKGNAEKGNRQMDEMMGAVGEINEASQSISKVIKTIDDIAFQTNILALNAAVEAARAGQHGKGFAVVAEEVRNLAAKSAEAAKETGGLIENSIQKASLGVRIAGETASSLTDIVSGINESDLLISEIARSSEEQSQGISQINTGIDQVAQVVQQNSATAEESAAASEEMSSQSTMLQQLISQFKLKDTGMKYRALPDAEGDRPKRFDTSQYSTPPQSHGDFGKY